MEENELISANFPTFDSFPGLPTVAIQQQIVAPIKKKRKRNKQQEKLQDFTDLDFYIDRKPELENVKYQSVVNAAIPLYKRCINLLSGWVIGKHDHQNHLIVFKKEQRDSKKINLLEIDPNPTRIKPGGVDSFTFGDFVRFEEFMFPAYEDSTLQLNQAVIFKRKTAEIEAKLAKNMTADLWLELVALQDELMDEKSSRKNAMKRMINSKQLAIFEKALSQMTNDRRLISAYMDCYQEYNDHVDIMQKWKEFLQRDSCLLLWQKYLLYRKCAPDFTVSSCLDVFEEAIVALRANETDCLVIFVNLCHLLLESGYSEKAIALFQGLLDVNLFCPSNLRNSKWNERLESFESFWESEAARFGEQGACGWDNPVEFTSENYKPDFDQFDDIQDQYQSWAVKEVYSQFYEWLPKRVDEDVEDIHRTILFDDIRPFLFALKSSKAKRTAIYYFLQFLGLSCKMGAENELDILQTNNLSYLFLEKSSDKVSINFPLITYPLTFWNLFGDINTWFPQISELDVKRIDFKYAYKSDMLVNVLWQSIPHLKDGGFTASQLLMFMGVKDQKIAEKEAKKMLKIDPVNMILYVAYAKLLEKSSKFDQARTIYKTAISMINTIPPENQRDLIFLYAMYADLEVSQGNNEAAISILTSFTKTSEPLIAIKA